MSRGLVLAVDASATTGTIALLADGRLVAEREVAMRSDAEERFLPAVRGTIEAAGHRLASLDAVVCGAGPGSFTSLRVVAAVAKGLVEGLGIPLFGMPSLGLIVAASEHARAAGSRWVASLDAMREERYLALVRVDDEGAIATVGPPRVVPASETAARAAELGGTPIGPVEAVAAEPHARGLAWMLALVGASGPVDVASWEPLYGRLAEAQVRWEAAHGRALPVTRVEG